MDSRSAILWKQFYFYMFHYFYWDRFIYYLYSLSRKIREVSQIKYSKIASNYEIDNEYDLKKLIQQYESESALLQQSFFKNLQRVYIYISYEQFTKKYDLISCLFSAFGKAEILSNEYGRKYLKKSSQFQKVFISADIDHEALERGLERVQQNDLIIKLKDSIKKYNVRYCAQSNEYLVRNNNQVNKIEKEIMKILVFNQNIAIFQAFNPKIIYYDLYENYKERNTYLSCIDKDNEEFWEKCLNRRRKW
ncbi:hypothetical protein ABPG74_018488 [Tetrahymena malaccensis]